MSFPAFPVKGALARYGNALYQNARQKKEHGRGTEENMKTDGSFKER